MEHTFAPILVLAWFAVATPAMAQQAQPAHASQSSEAAFTEGEVRKVDKAAGKITLKHGEIKNLDMPPMTMVFGVKDGSLMEQVKAGDKIRFRASNDDGKFTLTEIQAPR